MKTNPLPLSLAVLLLAGTAARALPAADFSVSITDGLGRPVPGAQVAVWFLSPQSGTNVQRTSLAKAVSDTNGLAKGSYDLGAVSPNGSVSIEISKPGYATSSAGPQADYVLRRLFHADDVARIAKLGSDAQKSELRELLAGEFDSPKQNLNELVFINGNRLRQTLRWLLGDPQVGSAAGELLAFIGLPEDLRLAIQYAPPPGKDASATRWANGAVSALLEPDSEREWAFIKQCALNEYDGHWVDAAAIRTLKLIASPRSLQMLNDVRRQNPYWTNAIDQAVAYINSRPAPLADKNLGQAAGKTAAALDAGTWMGNDDPRYNLERDMALIDCNFLAGRSYLVLTARFQKTGDMWKLRGVRETKQTVLPAAPEPKNAGGLK
jgi:hypothetical protein